MKNTTVNYNAIASNYDGRIRQGTYLVGVTDALQALAQRVNARRVLDLGCGTGRSLEGIATRLSPPACYGLDLSTGMLAQAQQLNHDYKLINASAASLPFAPISFDLICCVHAFHHFPHKPQVVQQAYTMVRPGGVLAIVNFDPRAAEQSWPVYDYFDGTYETDLRRFPSTVDQEAMLTEAGFDHVQSPIVQIIKDETVGEAILNSYHLQKEACSQLVLITEAAYQAGLERMRQAITTHQTLKKEAIFRTRLLNRMTYGFKPE